MQNRLDSRFIDSHCFEQVLLLTERFPAKASDCFGFERYLGRDDRRIDFALGISDLGKRWLAANRPWPELDEVIAQAAAQEPGGTVRPWLAFDTSTEECVHVPSIYVGLDLDQSSMASMRALAVGLSRSTTTSIEVVERCTRYFPVSVVRVYFGFMRSRQATGLRLSVGNLNYADVETYLRNIQWPGDIDVVVASLRRLNLLCSGFGVQIDIATNVTPWLGIELILNTPETADRLGSLGISLLQFFVKEQWCSTDEATYLQCWPTRTQYIAPLIDRLINAHHPRPDAHLLHGTLLTALHHFKLVYEHSGSIRLKAYFGVYVNLA